MKFYFCVKNCSLKNGFKETHPSNKTKKIFTMLSTIVCLFMAVGGVLCSVALDQCKNSLSLVPTLSCT